MNKSARISGLRKHVFLATIALFSLQINGQVAIQKDWQKNKVSDKIEKGNALQCDSIVKRDYDNKPLEKIINIFDGSGHMASRIRQSYEAMKQSYTNSEKYDYEYDEYGNVSASIYSKWNVLNAQWEYQEKQEEDFNKNGKKNIATLLFMGIRDMAVGFEGRCHV